MNQDPTTPKIPCFSTDNATKIPLLGFGTWKLGGDMVRDPKNDDTRDVAAIRYAIERGIRHIDTAEIYAEGHAEEIVAQAIHDIPRTNLFLASKVRAGNLTYQGVLDAARRSLDRLKTDYLDLYYIHSFNPAIPLAETMRALTKLSDDRLVRALAVSNFSVARIKAAQALTSAKIVATQVHYNLRFRGPEQQGLLEYCQKNKIALMAWRPVQYGEFTEAGRYPLLDSICKKYQKTPAQVAINWLLSHSGVGTLFMSRSRTHIDENLGALGWSLEPSDRELLAREFPDQQADSDRMPIAHA